MTTSRRMKWERPEIVEVQSLPAGMGNCEGGSTQTLTSCADGGYTGTDGHSCSVGTTPRLQTSCGTGTGAAT